MAIHNICICISFSIFFRLGLYCSLPACPPCTPCISFLFVRLRFRSLLGSLAATPLVEFHHRLTACLSHTKKTTRFGLSFPFIHIQFYFLQKIHQVSKESFSFINFLNASVLYLFLKRSEFISFCCFCLPTTRKRVTILFILYTQNVYFHIYILD